MSNKIIKHAVGELSRGRVKDAEDLMRKKRQISKKYGISILGNSDLIKEVRRQEKCDGQPVSGGLMRLLRKRQIRTQSGIAPVAVLTRPHPCPGKCAYCPTEKGVPQSYLSNEPAVMRAIRCNYDPYKQVQLRLKALEANGHEPTKIELIVIGGTWSALPRAYQYLFIKECFRGANRYASRKLKVESIKQKVGERSKIELHIAELRLEQKFNEKAKYRIVGITVETRPDHIDEAELWRMRELGVTRVELGVQAADDAILKKNRRGHGVARIVEATRLLKDFGFKVTYHIMPGLPGATAKKDLAIFRQLFTDERFQPDQIKFYPTVVTKGSLLYRWWRAGKYKPYPARTLENLIVKCKAAVPPYVRIIRLIRDIPGESIVAGNKVTNLRQVLQAKGVKCACIRCREAREREFKVESIKLKVIEYQASGGREYFLQYTDESGEILYGFCRLRLALCDVERGKDNVERVTRNVEHGVFSAQKELFFKAGLVRELHVYGELVPVGGKRKVQHAGLGKLLMQAAERIAREQDCRKLAVIAGVGVRDYYRKIGYRLQDHYMVKSLK